MFVVKKIIGLTLSPVSLCMGLLIAGLLLLLVTRKQRTGRCVLALGVILFAIFAYSPIPTWLLKGLESQYPPLISAPSIETDPCDVPRQVKWIVVLGGGHTSDPKVPVTSQISRASLVRLIEAVRIHGNIPGSKLILAGGPVFDILSEAETMARVARIAGVNQENLILETKSLDTGDQAQRIKPIVGNDMFILVTSAVHIPRSMAMFRKLGMNPIAAPAGHMILEGQGVNPGGFFPSTGKLGYVESVFHEYLGFLWAKMRGQI
ncbi:MAG: YdcF family protein [Candidatus Brocadiaceae bacterium]|nr:YdcF family protein [Candidatus Brocadiaceae bacterium]